MAAAVTPATAKSPVHHWILKSVPSTVEQARFSLTPISWERRHLACRYVATNVLLSSQLARIEVAVSLVSADALTEPRQVGVL
jgi:hypothetical protein